MLVWLPPGYDTDTDTRTWEDLWPESIIGTLDWLPADDLDADFVGYTRANYVGYFAYRLPDRITPHKIRLLEGAFPSEAAASEIAKALQKEDFTPTVVQR